MVRFAFVAAALAGTALALPAAAAPQAKAGAKTAARISPQVKAEFTRSDTNKDGFLSRAEVAKRVGRMDVGRAKLNGQQVTDLSSVWFARADGNHDGKISQTEMQALLTATARRYDTNGDGVVSVSERQAARVATLNEVRRTPAGPPAAGR